MRMLLMAGIALCMAQAPGRAGPAADPIPALERHPGLRDFFPFGFWWADGCFTVKSTEYLHEDYYARADKILHDMARHYVSAVIPSNRVLQPRQLDLAAKYGMRIATMPLFLSYPRELPDIIALFVQHAGAVKDHPAFLGYHLYDEPTDPKLFGQMQAVARALQEADPAHPAFYTHNSLPVDASAQEALRHLDVHLSDHYSVSPPFGRDAWSYGDVFLPQMREANPQALHWPILQAFGYPQMPTVPELRVMVYHTLACGAKGVFFFSAGQAFVHWQDPFYPLHAGNAWYAGDPWLAEIGRMGKHLTAAGPLLVPRHWTRDYPATVQGPSFRATARGWKECVRRESAWDMPAIHVGAFAGQGGDVLVVHNDDPWQAHEARVSVSGRGSRVYDLYDLAPVRARRRRATVSFGVFLAPGQGRLYLVGQAADFAAARQTVLRHRHEQEERLLLVEAGLAEANGLAVAPVRHAVAAASGPATDPADALAAVLRARERLEGIQKVDRAFSRQRDALEAMRSAFSAINDWLIRHPDDLQGDAADPRVRALADRALALTREFGALENAFRAAKAEAAHLEALRERVERLRAEVLRRRPSGLSQRRVAVLRWNEGCEETAALAEWLRGHYEHVAALPVTRVGRPPMQGLAGQGLLWIHLGGNAPPARAIYAVAADVDRRALPFAARRAIREFVAQGGGLVLSGLAACLVDDLGLDPQPPNECYWGSMALPGGIAMTWAGWSDTSRQLGLRPLAPEHPLFAGLPPGGFAVWEYDTAELISRAVWRRPKWPRRGRALAGYWSNGAEMPPEFAVAVDYTRPGAGKVVAIGEGIGLRRGAFWQPGRRAGTPQDRLIRNLVEYCARP